MKRWFSLAAAARVSSFAFSVATASVFAQPVAPMQIEHVIKRLPDPQMEVRFLRRVAGLGSLGRERYAAVGICGEAPFIFCRHPLCTAAGIQ